MISKTAVFFLLTVLLLGCGVSVDEDLISTQPAPKLEFVEARKAAALCAKHAPDWAALEEAFKSAGYAKSKDPRLAGFARSTGTAVLDKANTGMRVLVGEKNDQEGACIIGLEGMTPEQSFALAQPWVGAFEAVTNAERGQGLSQNAAQAWASFEAERIIYIVAYKTWNVLFQPGAAVRLIYIER
ncbi:MAG: hypothetical protein AAGD04_05305 [Pseudomonadota bacterium]